MLKVNFYLTGIFATLIITENPVYARQWTEFFRNDSLTSLLDVDSIKGIGSTREFWVRSIYKEEKIGYLSHTSSLHKYHVNCDTQKIGSSKTVLYNSVGSPIFTTKEISEPEQWKEVLPDSLGEAMLTTICKMRDPQSDMILRSRTSSTSGETMTQEKAINLIQRWLQAKQRLFAPPYDRQLAVKLTTGKLYQDLTSPNGSIDWLEKNNSRYEYGIQRVRDVKRFSKSDDRFAIVVYTLESYTLFNGKGTVKKTDNGKQSLIRYEFIKVNDSWRLEDYQSLDE